MRPDLQRGKFYTYKKDVPLGQGQSLGFTTGRGYYARSVPAASRYLPQPGRPPAPRAPSMPAPTPLSPKRFVPDIPGKGRIGSVKPMTDAEQAAIGKKFRGITSRQRSIDPGFRGKSAIAKALAGKSKKLPPGWHSKAPY